MKDTRLIIGAGFIALYYASLWVIGFRAMPPANVALIKDAMLQLGPPIGIIIGALFRSDALDEKRAETTRAAFDAVTATAQAATTSPAPDVTLQPGETAQAAPAKEPE